MKDPIIQEIHRRRTEYAKRFKFDVDAIGQDIRRGETESGGKFAAGIPRRKHSVGVNPAKTGRRKSVAAPK
jgi:hypothetical protein